MSKYETMKNGLVKDIETGATGIFRTVGGRRIFIKDGQDLASAMKESGKFSETNSETAKDSEIKNLQMEDMDEQDKKLLYGYTQGYYNTTNTALRNNQFSENNPKVEELDNVLKKGYIENETLYRTAHLNELGLNIDEDKLYENSSKLYAKYTKDLPAGSDKYMDGVYKAYAENNKNVYDSIKEKLKIGDTTDDRAYKSTSTTDEIALKYNTLYAGENHNEIPAPTQAIIKYNVIGKLNAIDIGKSSYVPDQNEILLQRNTKQRITKVEYSEKYNCTYVEMDLFV